MDHRSFNKKSTSNGERIKDVERRNEKEMKGLMLLCLVLVTSACKNDKDRAVDLYADRCARTMVRTNMLKEVPRLDDLMGYNSKKDLEGWKKTMDSITKIHNIKTNCKIK